MSGCRLFLLFWAILVSAAGARAQLSASLTSNVTVYNTAGGQVVLTASVNYRTVAAPTALGFTVTVPAGWALVSTGGSDVPQIKPSAGTTGALEYAYTSAPANQATFTLTVSYPAGLTGNQTIFSSALYRAPTTNVSIPDIVLTGNSGPVAVAPQITTQPASTTVVVGQPVLLSVTTTGTPAPLYQWRKGGAALTGQTTSSLSISAATTSDAGGYDVVVSNSAGSVTSNVAVLTVNSPPTISAQPLGLTVAQGQTASFSVTATGNPAPSFQWRKEGNVLAGATNSTLTLSNVALTAAGNYDVVVSNSFGAVTSRSVTLTVNATSTGLPVITQQPASQEVTPGGSVTLTVIATSSTTLSYQWRRDGVAIPGATASVLALSGTTVVAGSYSVVVTNSTGPVTSATAEVRLVDLPPNGPKPVITQQPTGRTATVGGTVALFVGSYGVGTLRYQWYKDGTALFGATAAELRLQPISTASAGTYRAEVSNAGGTVASTAAVVVVSARESAPVIAVQPSSQTVISGGSATFAVVATGVPGPTYQWRRNGTNLAGAIGPALTLDGGQAANGTAYDVVVSNSAGMVISSVATLTVAPSPVLPVITRQPLGLTRAVGRAASLAVTASGAPAPGYQWRKDGLSIPGATSSTLSFSALTGSDAGSYSVAITNSAGSVISANATISVRQRSYGGTWFGSLGTGGYFALRIEEDSTGVFLGFAPGSRTAYISRGVSVDDAGRWHFAASVESGQAVAAAVKSDSAILAASADELVFDGSIADDGTLTGTSSGTAAISLTAAKSSDAGVSSAFAGYFQAGTAGGSSQALAIVGPAGQAMVVTQGGGAVDAGTGLIDATGQVAITTAGQQAIAGSVGAESLGFVAAISDAKGGSKSFAGFASNSPALADQRLVNISTRTTAGTGDQVAIVGFVIDGVESKPVLIRAVGPTLGSFGVAQALTAPRIVLNREGSVVASNTGWSSAGNTAAIEAAAARSGAFPLNQSSADSAVLVTLAPGSYTAVVSAADGRTGVGLVEVYDLSGGSLSQRLTNISTRAVAGKDDATLIAGLVVAGTTPKRVLIRGIGPTLAQFGLTGVLARPQLKVVRSDGLIIVQNAGAPAAADATFVAQATEQVGAFSLPVGSEDAALVLNLAPGAYTVQVSGAMDTTGIALVELYELR